MPDFLYLPLQQHAGSPAIALVAPGDQVKKGQLIAEAEGRTSAPIHAPTSGEVVSIDQHVAPHPSGLPGAAIVIKPDGNDEWCSFSAVEDPWNLPPDELARKIEDAGVVGMGGAAFPSAVKLGQARGKVDTVIINGAECEPYLTCDDRLMQERADDVVSGIRLMLHTVGAKRALIGIEANKPIAAKKMRDASAHVDFIDVVVVPTRFPTGSGKQLTYVLTGREVPAGGRSHDAQIIVHNVATAAAVHDALIEGRPLLSRIVTVAGGALSAAANYEALLGTPVQHLLECVGQKMPPARLVLGGPMTGHALFSDLTPVVKGTCGVLALTAEEIGASQESPCIRCGSCVDACPMGLVPLEMASHIKADDAKGAGAWGLSDCILCGCCSYTCPSHIPLVHYFQFGRDQLKAKKADERRSKEILQRIGDRTDRIERLAAEKKAQAKARAAERAAARKKKQAAKARAQTTGGNA